MNAVERIADGTVFHAVALNDLKQRTTLAMRDIAEADRLAVSGNRGVELLEVGRYALHEIRSFPIDDFPLACHLLLPECHQFGVRFCVLHLEHGIALLQGLVVAVQGIDIRAV